MNPDTLFSIITILVTFLMFLEFRVKRQMAIAYCYLALSVLDFIALTIPLLKELALNLCHVTMIILIYLLFTRHGGGGGGGGDDDNDDDDEDDDEEEESGAAHGLWPAFPQPMGI